MLSELSLVMTRRCETGVFLYSFNCRFTCSVGNGLLSFSLFFQHRELPKVAAQDNAIAP